MKVTKRHIALADMFKAVSHPARLAALELCMTGEKCVSDIMSELGLYQSATSQHLTHLKHHGLVSCKVDKVMRLYSVTKAGAKVARLMEVVR